MPLPLVQLKTDFKNIKNKHLVAEIFVCIKKVKARMLLNRQEPGFSDFEQITDFFLACFLSVHKIVLQYFPLALHIPH